MRRSAVSIPSNIAEGKNRQTKKEYVQFLYIAKGSCSELDTQVIISNQLGFLDDGIAKELEDKLDHISRMLTNLIKGLKQG